MIAGCKVSTVIPLNQNPGLVFSWSQIKSASSSERVSSILLYCSLPGHSLYKYLYTAFTACTPPHFLWRLEPVSQFHCCRQGAAQRLSTAPGLGVCEWSTEGLHDKSVSQIPNTDEILKLLKKKMINWTPLGRHPGLELQLEGLGCPRPPSAYERPVSIGNRKRRQSGSYCFPEFINEINYHISHFTITTVQIHMFTLKALIELQAVYIIYIKIIH